MARATARSPRQPRPSAKAGPRGTVKKIARPAPPRPAAKRPAPPKAKTKTAAADRCTEVLRRLQKFIENEFSPAERARIDAHLAGCPDCRREYEAMRSLIDTLDATRIVAVPDSFRAAVMSKIRKG